MIAFFKKFDNDCDTELTPPDFVKGFQSYAAQIGQEKAYSAKMLKAAYKAAHTSGDGGLSFPEFLRFVGRNGRINIDPFALAKVADFTLPPGETYGVKPPEALAAEMAQQAHQDARAQRIAAMKAQREAMQRRVPCRRTWPRTTTATARAARATAGGGSRSRRPIGSERTWGILSSTSIRTI